jgi:DNA-directed RNA polymerase specialized sigma24 family protein
MGIVPDELRVMFERCRAGESQWDGVFESLRPELFDYLLRMTGDMSRSISVTDEVFGVVLPQADGFEDLDTLRLSLLVTARSFSIDGWHAHTSQLVHPLLDGTAGDAVADDVVKAVPREEMRAVDEALKRLPPLGREAILLRLRHGLEFADVAKTMLSDESTVYGAFCDAVARVRGGLGVLKQDVELTIAAIPPHPMPERSLHQTMNLSVLVQDLRSTRSGVGSRRWLWLAVVLALVAAGTWIVWWFLGRKAGPV